MTSEEAPKTLEECLVLCEGLRMEIANLQKDKTELQAMVRGYVDRWEGVIELKEFLEFTKGERAEFVPFTHGIQESTS